MAGISSTSRVLLEKERPRRKPATQDNARNGREGGTPFRMPPPATKPPEVPTLPPPLDLLTYLEIKEGG
jgi:hypothetical protein